MPEDNSNSKRAFRYPFYSSELLVCCENSKILESFFGKDKYQDQNINRSLLHKLFQFFLSDEDVNPVLAGYVCNVLINLLKMSTDIFLAEFYNYSRINDNFNLIKMNQYLRIKKFDRSINQITLISFSFRTGESLQLIIHLQGAVGRIVDNSNFEVSTNLSHIIQEITQKAYLIIQHSLFLISYLEIQQIYFVNLLFITKNMYLASGIALYNQLTLHYKIITRQGDPSESAIFQVDQQELFNVIVSHLRKWLEFLLQQSITPIFGYSQVSKKIYYLQYILLYDSLQHKIKIPEIIGVCISLNQQSFVNKLQELDIFKVYNQLFIKYEKHGILHLKYLRFLVHIIEQKFDNLVQNLFNQNDFIQFLLKCTSEKINNQKQRKEYLGFVTKLAHFLEEFSSKYPLFQFELEKESWKIFKNQYFDKAERLNNHELCGHTHTRADYNEEVDFNKEEIQTKYDIFLNLYHEKKIQNETNIQNIFDTFKISDSEENNSVNVEQQEWSGFSWPQDQSNQSDFQFDQVPKESQDQSEQSQLQSNTEQKEEVAIHIEEEIQNKNMIMHKRKR